VAVHHVVRQAECHTELAHLVLEQVAQRLQQLLRAYVAAIVWGGLVLRDPWLLGVILPLARR
jgi:hypothetical protein